MLIKRFTSIEQGKTLHTYWRSACKACPLKEKCTTSTERRVKRWEHEAVLEAMQARLKDTPEAMQIRKQTVEHPFGTLKAWMGRDAFSNEDTGSRQYRDEFACARVQPQAGDENTGDRSIDAGHERLMALMALKSGSFELQ